VGQFKDLLAQHAAPELDRDVDAHGRHYDFPAAAVPHVVAFVQDVCVAVCCWRVGVAVVT
jgi:hypothetical protein